MGRSKSDAVSDDDKDSSVNLGLTDLLEGRTVPVNLERPAPPSMPSSQAPAGGALFGDLLSSGDEAGGGGRPDDEHSDDVQGDRIDKYAELAAAGKWEELRITTEHELGRPGVGEEVRLWWILSQLHRDEMPATVLLGPFNESISALLKGEENALLAPPYSDLMNQTAALLASRLESAGEGDLCISTLERAYRIGRNRALGDSLYRLAVEALEKLPRRVTFHTPSEMKKRLHLLELRRELESERREEFTFTEEPERPDTQLSASTVVEGSGPSRSVVVAGLLALLLGVLWIALNGGYLRSNEDLRIAGDIGDSGVPPPVGVVPSPLRINEVSHLAALAYDVAGEGERVESRDLKGAATDSKQAGVAPAAAEVTAPPVVTAPGVVPQLAVRKQQIQTQGPVETDRIRDLIEGGAGSRYGDDPPLSAPDDRRRDDRPRRDDPDRRPPRPRREYDDDRPYLDRRDRPGRWEGGTRYEVMINTSVMERPSFHAREVAELYVGDRVLVDARVGRWLKLRSQKGVPGYILAQDAEKLYD